MDLSHMDHQMEQQSSIMPESERMDLIAAAIEEMRPGLQLDGGDLELVSVEGQWVRVPRSLSARNPPRDGLLRRLVRRSHRN